MANPDREQIRHPQTGEPFWIPRVSNLVTDTLRRGEVWEPALDALAPILGASGDLVIEVGAYCGEHTVVLRQYAPVLAIEPQAQPYTCLLLNSLALGEGSRPRRSIIPLQIFAGAGTALQPRADVADAHPSNGWTPLTGGVGTYAQRLDALLPGLLSGTLPRVGALKIDAQGMDLLVVQGAEAIVVRDRPLIVCEFEPSYAAVWGHTSADYLGWFAAHDYHPPIAFAGGNLVSGPRTADLTALREVVAPWI